MNAADWITYRTRFLVKAKQLADSLSFTDAVGRQHSGRKGDYLVEFTDGVIRIVPREFFEDVYVPLFADQDHPHQTNEGGMSAATRHQLFAGSEFLGETDDRLGSNASAASVPIHLQRKAPQSYRNPGYLCARPT